MCGRGSATSPSSGSARLMFATGRSNWPPRLAASRCWHAVPSCIASYSSLRMRARFKATRSARRSHPSAASTPSSCSGETKRRAYTPRRSWPAPRSHPAVLVGSRPHVSRHGAAIRRAGRSTLPASPSRSARSRPPGRRRALPGRRPVRQRLQAPPQERRRHPGAAPRSNGDRVHPSAAPPNSDPDLLVFTGPGGGNGVPVGSRTMLSRYNFRRVYQRAVARAGHDLVAVDPHGPHDLRHTFSTWLEDAGIPARVIDELMGQSGAAARNSRAGVASVRGIATPHPRWPSSWPPRSRSDW